MSALLCPAMAATERDVREPVRRDAVRRRRADRSQIGQRLRAETHPAHVRPRVQPGADTVIEFRGVSKLYGPEGVGLERATFAVNRQEMVFLVGATGSGGGATPSSPAKNSGTSLSARPVSPSNSEFT